MKNLVKSLMLLIMLIFFFGFVENAYSIIIINKFKTFNVKKSHPRLFLDQKRLKELQRMKGDKDFYRIVDFVDRACKGKTEYQSRIKGNCPEMVLMPFFFVAMTTEKPQYISFAKRCLQYLLAIPANYGDDTPQRNRLYSLALGYDWLYKFLTPTERTRVANRIIEYLKLLDEKYHFISKPNYVSGHSRWANIVALAGTLAMYYEDKRIKPYFAKIYDNWVNGYLPALNYLGKGGGHRMGWRYGSGYTSPEASLMWHSATGKYWNLKYYEEAPYFFLYGIYNKADFPMSGDCWWLHPGEFDKDVINLIAASAGYAKSPFGEWFFQKYLKDQWAPFKIIRLITKKDLPPAASPRQLPLAHYFSGSGFVINRDSWHKKAMVLTFKSTPYYTQNHHHRDENSLAINYKGPLLLDSGVYDYYGSDHWRNYYTQTIAHNSLVFSFAANSVKTYGQYTRNREPQSVAELKRRFKLDGITNFYTNKYGTWSRGNATKAYSSKYVKEYLRDVFCVYRLKNHRQPVVLVVDRVKFTRKLFPKLLWHVQTKPTLADKDNYALISNQKGGFGRLEFFSNAQLKITKIGGRGRRFEVNGVNYQPQISRRQFSPEAGWGRIELSVSKPVKKETLVTFLVLDNQKVIEKRVARAKFIQGTGWVGVKFAGSFIINISRGAKVKSLKIDSAELADCHEILVAGVKNQKLMKLDLDREKKSFTKKDGNHVIIKIK